MKISINDSKKGEPKNLDLFLTGVCAGEETKTTKDTPFAAPKELSKIDKALANELMAAAHSEGFVGKAGQSFVLRTLKKSGPKMIGLIGLGKESAVEVDTYRKLGAIAFKLANDKRAPNAHLHLPAFGKVDSSELTQAALEGIQLAQYRFDKYLTEDKPETRVSEFNVGTIAAKPKDILSRSEAICEGVCLARDLINDGPLAVHPVGLAALAKKEGTAVGLDVTILDEDALAKENMNLMLAVSRASLLTTPPRLIRLAYRPSKKAKKHIALVGKGVTFDSGGLDIKPADGMRDMKVDMSGAAAVLGTMLAVAKIKPDVAVTGYMVCVENGIGSNAYHPGDVIKSRKGITVEIDNTDAEGRLILADGLDYAQDKDNPDILIDIATLTGACMVALGPNTAGILSNNTKLAESIREHGQKAGEDFWRLPLNDELYDQLKSQVADMKNSGSRLGGAITGALFLKKFVRDKVEWAHLDIAGPATCEKDHVYKARGGAGFCVRTLVELICKH